MTSAEHEPRRPKKVLLAGAAGFIGSNLVHWLFDNWSDVQIVSLDALTYAGNIANLEDVRDNPRHRFVHGSICDRSLVDELLNDGIEAIVNAAAHTHVDRSLMDGTEFVSTNVGGVQVLVEALMKRPKIRFLQISTDEVYGSQAPDERACETSPLCPTNPYSATKAAGDLIALAYQHSFQLDIVVTRCTNNYGPYQFPEKVIPLFITNLLEGRRVPLYGDGLNVREWIHVDDHASAIARVLEAGRSGEVYNVSSGDGVANIELTKSILNLMGKDDSHIEYVEDRPGHDRRYAIDNAKIRRELGWSSKRRFEEGLAETVEWYQSNEAWWRAIKSGEYRKFYEQLYGARTKS